MAVLCQLADPQGYRAFDWNLMDKPDDLAYWLNLFAGFPAHIEKRLREDGLTGDDFEQRWTEFCAEYAASIEAIKNNPAGFGEITPITLSELCRQHLLAKYGWLDPYAVVKKRENEIAARIYPEVVDRIEATLPDKRWAMILRSLFAGNMFDLGSPETIDLYNRGQVDFFSFLNKIPDRPWFIDHLDQLRERLDGPQRRRQVLFFVDNAGADIVLGVVPLAREMARGGTRVVLAANLSPALNDITIDELNPLLRQLAACDPLLSDLIGDGRITAVGSGGINPLIDLSRVSDECNAVAADSDLIILEGMGRAIESNWDQKFLCDVCRVALVKDVTVARWIGATLFSAVCRFDPLPSQL